jgi:nucleoside 2-deoxyribosyltransferase
MNDGTSRRRTMPKPYLAGPLFTLAEQSFNVDLARFLKKQGFEVWLPQDHEPRQKKGEGKGKRSAVYYGVSRLE